jgi:hypothetical protein
MVLVSAALLAMVSAGGNLAYAQAAAGDRPSESVTGKTQSTASGGDRPTESLTSAAQLQAAGERAKETIMASSTQKAALLVIFKKQDISQAKAFLQQNGFAAKQLDGAQIVLNDKTGGHGTPASIRIQIEASCCPLRIVITIS